jgi:lysozyme family protein
MSWESALHLWIDVEGGFVLTNPPEGPTWCGALQTYYFQWCAKVGRDATWPPTQEAHASYLYDEIWTPHHCGEVPDPADAVAFQMFGNLPWKAGNQTLQIALTAYPDGVIGMATLASIRLWDARELAQRIVVAQTAHYVATNEVGKGNFDGLILGRIGKVRKFLAGP